MEALHGVGQAHEAGQLTRRGGMQQAVMDFRLFDPSGEI
jgi:hypothetical protein